MQCIQAILSDSILHVCHSIGLLYHSTMRTQDNFPTETIRNQVQPETLQNTIQSAWKKNVFSNPPHEKFNRSASPMLPADQWWWTAKIGFSTSFDLTWWAKNNGARGKTTWNGTDGKPPTQLKCGFTEWKQSALYIHQKTLTLHLFARQNLI